MEKQVYKNVEDDIEAGVRVLSLGFFRDRPCEFRCLPS